MQTVHRKFFRVELEYLSGPISNLKPIWTEMGASREFIDHDAAVKWMNDMIQRIKHDNNPYITGRVRIVNVTQTVDVVPVTEVNINEEVQS